LNYPDAHSKLPLAKEGLPFIGICLAFTLFFILVDLPILACLAGGLTLFVGFFFRDPERHLPHDPAAILAPADGKILKIEHMEADKSPLGVSAIKLSIFMSLFNVHVNRCPTQGVVEEINYKPGKFFSAQLDKASKYNERNSIFLKTPEADKILLIQIAGIIARRIVCWLKAGDKVAAGQRLGLIRFGSRVEVYLPSHCRIVVEAGQKVKAGQTIMGYSS